MSRDFRRAVTAFVFAVHLAGGVATNTAAQAADGSDPPNAPDAPDAEFDYDEAYYRALRLYGESGDFDAALAVVDTLLATDPPDQQRREAYELQALCLVGAGREEEAKGSFCGILCVDEFWRPDLRFGPAERDVFARVVYADCGCEQDSGGLPWKWIGAAAAIVAGSMIPLLGGDDAPSSPPPPDEPGVPPFPDEP